MKHWQHSSLVALVLWASSHSLSAQSVAFGPIDPFLETSAAATVVFASGHTDLEIVVNYSAAITITPAVTGTYTLQYNSVAVQLSSADPQAAASLALPQTLQLGPVTSVPWPVQAGIDTTITLSKSVTFPLPINPPLVNARDLIVSWSALSVLAETGGKGFVLASEDNAISGTLTPVPEPAWAAVAAGLGLLLAALHRHRRH